MKKLYSLIRACMTSDMNLFKFKTKKKGKASSLLLPLFIAGYLMFMVWSGANGMFEKMAPMNLQHVILSLLVFGISIMTIIEGVYKTGSLIFNCRDDQLLLSLPIKRSTVLFIRIFKFYVFELLFNSLFMFPVMLAYIRWANNLTWTYFLTSFIMLFLLPIIPIVISCIIGAITSSLSSRFKYKNAAQIILSIIFILAIFVVSSKTEGLFNYLVAHATSINDLITKLYYPAGAYASLVTNFKLLDLIIFISVNIGVYVLAILILSKFYFKINSRLKNVTTTKKIKLSKLTIKSRSIYESLIRKELNTFFNTPVLVINSGFSLVLYIIAAILITIKFNSLLPTLTSSEVGLSKELIMSNLSVFIMILISACSFMTSITNSLVSLEGKNINIVKGLPLKSKTILMSKVYACLVLTTPIFFIGNIILFIRFKISIIESLLLLVISVLAPMISHFIGILVNLKYPKLDFENTTEVVKQSTSSFISVLIGMILLVLSITGYTKLLGVLNPILILLISIVLYSIILSLLYLYLNKKGVKEFDELSI